MTRKLVIAVLFLASAIALQPNLGQSQNNPGKGGMINQSYQIAFCRLPGDAEFKYWMVQNDGRVANLQSLLKAHREWLQNQAPEQHQVVVRAYQQGAGRMPSDAEIATWRQKLSQGYTNCSDIVSALRRR